MCYCPKFPAVTKDPIDFVVLYWITRTKKYFLVFLTSKLVKKWQKSGKKWQKKWQKNGNFYKKTHFFMDKKRVLWPQISSYDQKSSWFWYFLLDYTKLCKLTIIYIPPELQIRCESVQNGIFFAKNTIFWHKNVCYCPQISICDKNPADIYVFCWIK